MNNIEIKVLNPEVISDSKKMMVTAARLTQHGHNVHNMDDFIELFNQDYSDKTVKSLVNLPHPTIQKFGVVNVVIVGASRRFLAQITRHQNEVKFISASCQYSDYSHNADFVIPYELLDNEAGREQYLQSCKDSLAMYEEAICNKVDHDSAAYMLPQGLRNILIISATPFQWKHMIAQRTCRRNTSETRYVMLKIWSELFNIDPIFFNGGPFCMQGNCKEGRMSCGLPMTGTPDEILKADFKLIEKEAKQ